MCRIKNERYFLEEKAGVRYSFGVSESIRIDKWLWAVRLYKSRTLAVEACLAGHVKIGGHSVKPAREVRAGDVIQALTGHLHRTVKVIGILEKRVGAKQVPDYLEDLTPPEEYERVRQEKMQPVIQYPKGWGRPTKKHRRQLDDLMGRS